MNKKKRMFNSIIYIVLSIMSVIWLIPIAWLVLISFREEPGAYTTYLMPQSYTLANYTNLFSQTDLFNFPQWFLNTFIVAIFTCLIATSLVFVVSYALSRLRFSGGREKLMNIGLVLGMFPGFMSMIAIYHILKAVGLDQTLTALVLVYSAGATINFFIVKGFLDTIPKSLDEAATIDGCTNNQVLWKIIIPMSRPIIVYTALTSFIAPWLILFLLVSS